MTQGLFCQLIAVLIAIAEQQHNENVYLWALTSATSVWLTSPKSKEQVLLEKLII
jgi:hypothetical protein